MVHKTACSLISVRGMISCRAMLMVAWLVLVVSWRAHGIVQHGTKLGNDGGLDIVVNSGGNNQAADCAGSAMDELPDMAVAIDPHEALPCPPIMQGCNPPCDEGTICQMTRAAPTACVPASSAAIVPVCGENEWYNRQKGACEPAPCKICPTVMPTCNCSDSEVCEIAASSCYQCAFASCKPRPPRCPDCTGGTCVAKRTRKDPYGEPAYVCNKGAITFDNFIPRCYCANLNDCIYVSRTLDKDAYYKCRNQCQYFPENTAICRCANIFKCIKQPRSCYFHESFYCEEQCVKCNEEEAKCPCSDPSHCIYRARTCFSCSYYECRRPRQKLPPDAYLLNPYTAF